MGWRFYAQRATTGEWLNTDVTMGAELTWELNGPGHVTAFIPKAHDTRKAVDGLALWRERSTLLYAELDRRLEWVGLCSFQRPGAAGRELEFRGLKWALDLIPFEGRWREWQPDPYDLVERLIDHAARQPNGDVGLTFDSDGTAADYAGDEQPPYPKPDKVHRKKGETKDDFEDRQEDRNKERDRWEKDYGDRKPYSLAWWEAPYVGEELDELAGEIPFEYVERHEWTDRDQLERRSKLVVSRRIGRQRKGFELIQGVNLAEVLDPVTNLDRYGNHLVALGAGEGRKMRRTEISVRDDRVRTTRYLQRKHVHEPKRLRALARDRFDRMAVGVKLDQATVRGAQAGLEVGDSIPITSDLFEGWARVRTITRSTASDNVTLTFSEA